MDFVKILMNKFTRNTEFWSSPTPNKVGPGSYNLINHKKNHSTFAPFSKAELKTSNSRVTPSSLPGPGSYSNNMDWIRNSSPSSSFLSKLPRTGQIPSGLTAFNDTPGPGSYETTLKPVVKPKKRYRQLSMIVEATVSSIPYKPGEDSVLGPTSYNPDHSLIKPKSNSVNFANKHQKRTPFESKTNPVIGPGKYNVLPEKHFEKGNWVFTSKVTKSSESRQDSSPGPGAYNPKHYVHQPRVLVEGFGSTTERDIYLSNQRSNYGGFSVSPKASEALYDLSKADYYRQKLLNPKTPVPKPAFGTSEKREPHWVNSASNVGPGDYKILKDDYVHARFVSKSPRFKESKNEAIPGPGAYDSIIPNSQAVVLSKAARFVDRKYDGPESYSAHEEWKLKQNKSKHAQYFEIIYGE